jgi:predicted phosphoadenosine phosphosulfate sulfurtransferase
VRRVELDVDVMTAARERVAWVFDTFPRICVSFSAGKDSSVLLHLVVEEARRRNQRVGVMLIDLEAQYSATIDHALAMYRDYADVIEPHWVALPIVLCNAVSQYEPRWAAWDPDARGAWVRQPPEFAVTDPDFYPFYRHAMEFEEFVEGFGEWYSQGEPTAILVGIRAQESLNRYRTLINASKTTVEGKRWTTWKGGSAYNVYPIYDWRTEDIWRANGKCGWAYNTVYDQMHLAGLTIHQARLCQPYGSDQRKGLWLFKVIEPETWARVVARVLGANTGSLYAHKSGGLFGRIKVNLPAGHTWESFAGLLLETMPPASREHYEAKIAVFLQWYRVRGVWPIPDDTDDALAERFTHKGPSWRRVAETLIKNDWWCKGLSFSQTKSGAHEKYLKVMKARRTKWGL